jgi:xylulokinase
MTGQMATEKTMMSSTGYYDIFHRTIWDEGLKKAGLDPEKIPSVKDSGEEIGRLNTSVAKELGITPGVPVLIAANDQMCSAVGGGNIVPGIITETTGTCLVAITTVDPPAFGQKAALEYNLHVNDKYIILQYAKTAGYILKWFKDEFCREEQKTCKRTGKHIYELMGQMAANIPPGSCGLTLYPYFAGKLSPQNQPAAKGVFFNVGLGVKKDHFVRAILEGVAYMLKENLDFIEENGVPIQQIRTLGGGSKSTIWNQIKADVCNKPVTVLQCEETTSMGAAIIASLALGWFSTFEEACHCCVLTEKIFFPDEKHAKFYQQSFKLYKKLDKSMRALYAKL